jgi:ribosomal protein L18
MAFDRIARRLKIKQRVRKNVHGTPTRPRLSIYRSNTGMYAQIIDDEAGHTLVSVSSLEGQEGQWCSEDGTGQAGGSCHRRKGEGSRASSWSSSTATDTCTMAG